MKHGKALTAGFRETADRASPGWRGRLRPLCRSSSRSLKTYLFRELLFDPLFLELFELLFLPPFFELLLEEDFEEDFLDFP